MLNKDQNKNIKKNHKPKNTNNMQKPIDHKSEIQEKETTEMSNIFQQNSEKNIGQKMITTEKIIEKWRNNLNQASLDIFDLINWIPSGHDEYEYKHIFDNISQQIDQLVKLLSTNELKEQISLNDDFVVLETIYYSGLLDDFKRTAHIFNRENIGIASLVYTSYHYENVWKLDSEFIESYATLKREIHGVYTFDIAERVLRKLQRELSEDEIEDLKKSIEKIKAL